MKKTKRFWQMLIFVPIGLCLGLLALSAGVNLGMQTASARPDTLEEAELARQTEFFHLRQRVGDAVWPGWGAAALPAITYNEAYAFLLAYPGSPPAGWVKVPAGTQRGGAWQTLAGKRFAEQAVYVQQLPPGVEPENFTVRVGEQWVSSLNTREWMQISLAETVRGDLPAFLRPVFPYSLFVGLMVNSDDQYISLAAHEAFHAWQGLAAEAKFSAALRSASTDQRYPWEDEALAEDWKAELEFLADTLRKDDPAALAGQAERFLQMRAERRKAAQLNSDCVIYEQQREWLEGLARYAELEIWRQGSQPAYQPSAAAAGLPDFNRYQGFEQRWRQELDQMPRMSNDQGDGRFYYSGMAQAYLLDRLSPGWKERAFEPGVWLEDLLAEAAAGAAGKD